MKASCLYALLTAVLAACKGTTVSAFLPPTTALARCSSSSSSSASALLTPSGSRKPLGIVQARAAARGRTPRLASAREDCKSCMEAELLEEERKRAAGDGGKGAASRRAALEEVRFRM